MFRHILIATGGSDLAQKATTNGLSLAKSVGAKVTAVTVFAPFHVYDVLPSAVMNDMPEAYLQYVEEVNADDWLGNIAKMANARGVRCNVMQVEEAQPHEGIINTAVERSHHHGVARAQRYCSGVDG